LRPAKKEPTGAASPATVPPERPVTGLVEMGPIRFRLSRPTRSAGRRAEAAREASRRMLTLTMVSVRDRVTHGSMHESIYTDQYVRMNMSMDHELIDNTRYV
jgi:hypothetical protein